VGTYAAELMIERIEDGGGPVKVLFLPPQLVVRASTAPFPAGRPASAASSRGRKRSGAKAGVAAAVAG